MKNVAPLLMSLLFLAILVGANIYLSRRFAWIFSMENRTWMHVLFAFLPVLAFAGMIGFSNATGFFGGLLYGTAAIITGTLLYLLLSLLVTDLARIFLQIKPVTYGIISFSLTVVVVVYGLWNATNTKLNTVNLSIEHLKEEVRIMHLSDIHLGHFRGKAYLQKLVDMTMAQDPDLVVLTGDLFDGRVQLKRETLDPLRQLGVPVLFVEGNHDGYSGVEKIKGILREAGVRVLENEIVQVHGLQIIGLNHMPADDGAPSMHAGQHKSTIRKVLEEMEIAPGIPSVLLHHSPDGIDYAVDK
ncbi:MAG: metallophosphoesterase, partial [Bacteroidales bacterium]|nr:metallophosphoesterase [Bacteroidales bacterium]